MFTFSWNQSRSIIMVSRDQSHNWKKSCHDMDVSYHFT